MQNYYTTVIPDSQQLFPWVATKRDTPKSENRQEFGTHSCILCYPHRKMKANRKQTGVEQTASTKKCFVPVSQQISDFGVSIPVITQYHGVVAHQSFSGYILLSLFCLFNPYTVRYRYTSPPPSPLPLVFLQFMAMFVRCVPPTSVSPIAVAR